uniref:C2H2-type domain-containing protein n=1 Tax=Timema genevievae TaxID=629358 RepID=A0A7R9PJ71_TIMGE|nr:unnamed protein product [Timema genevievae]
MAMRIRQNVHLERFSVCRSMTSATKVSMFLKREVSRIVEAKGGGLVAVTRNMKDTTSSDRADPTGARCDSPSNNNNNNNNNHRVATSTNASLAPFSGPGGLPLISPTGLFTRGAVNPLRLHATLTSDPTALYRHLFPWPDTDSKPRTDSISGGVTRRNQHTARRRGKVRTTDPAEPATAEVAAMTQPPAAPEPLSPPTSGCSPPSSSSEAAPGAGTNAGKVFTCGICMRSFGYKHVLQNHERTHTGEKPFECGECGKRFTRDHHLKTHMRLHTGEKPYHCTHCDRHFVQVANLRRHLRVHTGERPYACELCAAKFSDSNQLKAHMLIHRGEKPFACPRCQGRFRRRHHLIHHKCPNDDEEYDVDMEEGEEEDVTRNGGVILAHNNNGSTRKSRVRKPREVRHVIRLPTPVLVPAPVSVLPEQTEPEDLSMSTGTHHHHHHQGWSHSSGDSPLSRSPVSSGEERLATATCSSSSGDCCTAPRSPSSRTTTGELGTGAIRTCFRRQVSSSLFHHIPHHANKTPNTVPHCRNSERSSDLRSSKGSSKGGGTDGVGEVTFVRRHFPDQDSSGGLLTNRPEEFNELNYLLPCLVLKHPSSSKMFKWVAVIRLEYDSNPDISVICGPVYCESDALYHQITVVAIYS